MTLYRGMQPWRHDAIRLKFGSYIDRAKLPVLPHVFGHVGRAQPPSKHGWQMLGNDQAGDCVMAGACHETMVWTWATGRAIPPFNTAQVLAQYYAQTGGQDTGLDPIDFAKMRCKSGIKDANSTVHKIKAFAAVDTVEEIMLSVFLFGACGIGLELPDNAEEAFDNHEPWNDTSGAPKPANGHYVPVVGKNTHGDLIVVTWGALQAVTMDYLDKYCAGGVCFFSDEYMMTTGVSPEAYDEAQLHSDLAQLGTTQTGEA
jgi:hypothetical protein